MFAAFNVDSPFGKFLVIVPATGDETEKTIRSNAIEAVNAEFYNLFGRGISIGHEAQKLQAVPEGAFQVKNCDWAWLKRVK